MKITCIFRGEWTCLNKSTCNKTQDKRITEIKANNIPYSRGEFYKKGKVEKCKGNLLCTQNKK